MGFILVLKKISLLFLVISAVFVSSSFAGRVYSKSMESKNVKTTHEELQSSEALNHDEASEIHERLLKVKTNDYGSYDPPPAVVKPPFKLIPN